MLHGTVYSPMWATEGILAQLFVLDAEGRKKDLGGKPQWISRGSIVVFENREHYEAVKMTTAHHIRLLTHEEEETVRESFRNSRNSNIPEPRTTAAPKKKAVLRETPTADLREIMKPPEPPPAQEFEPIENPPQAEYTKDEILQWARGGEEPVNANNTRP